ncbi:MAG: gliding motility-associated C-terminal domain-containing protein [Phaeodactylibacter sp.]|nr:gliding motility-associated C-terminal domain-containing protein [Phaeodactylibacter sp.]
MKRFFLVSGLLTLMGLHPLLAQPINDECLGATQLTELTNWCSAVAAYTNVDATPSGIINASCFPAAGEDNDVWFSFVAVATDVNINVIGNTAQAAGGTLENPQFALYAGNCGNLTEIQCASDAFGANFAETFAGPLIIGQTYYIRVDAREGNEGTFQLCINNFNQIPEPDSDCPTGVVLCDKSPFTVESLIGSGVLNNEIDPASCIQTEFSSAWYKWTCDMPGTLAFTLTPNNPTDDLDFAVYELPNGIDNCNNKIELRCMASGENVGSPFSEWEPCTGATGLALSSTDFAEFPGCAPGDDNFVAAIDMEAGKVYALVINNFTNNGNGFGIQFSGTGTFLGPEPDFEITPELANQCDIDLVTFVNTSIIPPGLTGSYEWFFGEGASPAVATGPGPHEVLYNSFGNKSILLRVTTDEGCIVSLVRELYIEPCCDPATMLDISLEDVIDPICFGEEEGAISVSGTGGTPGYQFSIDGVTYRPIGEFINLLAGDYTIYIQDIKGCMDSVDAVIINPLELIVDAGPDQTINLGEQTELDGSLISPNAPAVVFWSPPETLDCTDCLDPDAMPFSSTTYYLTALDELGCTDVDSVRIYVVPVRPVYIPNVFSPNADGTNDFFTVFGGPAVQGVLSMKIFSRWGELVYNGRNLPVNNEGAGWDGTFNGERMGSAVFVYLIEVQFIDGAVGLYKGDVTLLR